MNRFLTLCMAACALTVLAGAPARAQFFTGLPGFPSPFLGRSSLQVSSTAGQVPLTIYSNGNFGRGYVGSNGPVILPPETGRVVYQPTVPPQAGAGAERPTNPSSTLGTGLSGATAPDNGAFNGNGIVTN